MPSSSQYKDGHFWWQGNDINDNTSTAFENTLHNSTSPKRTGELVKKEKYKVKQKVAEDSQEIVYETSDDYAQNAFVHLLSTFTSGRLVPLWEQ